MAGEAALDWLAPGERIQVEAKPHGKSFLGLALSGLVLGGILVWLGLDVGHHAAHSPHGSAAARLGHLRAEALFAAGAAVPLVAVVVGFSRWRGDRYFVTDQRVVVRHSLLAQSGADLPLDKVGVIRYRRGLADRIFGTGTVLVSSGSFPSVRLRSIREPVQTYAAIYEGHRAAAQPSGARFGPPPPAVPPPAPPSSVPSPPAVPPPAPVIPTARPAYDGPPVPPWLREDPEASARNP